VSDDATPSEGADEPSPASETGLHARSFTAWPAWADLSLDVVQYGPDIPTETELRLLGTLDGRRVLELGCGGGPITVALAKQGARVIAVDDSADQIGHARRLCEREEVKAELHQGDLAELAFIRGDSIDVALSVYALGAVEDLNRVFRQVHRVLKPEAPLVLSIPHPTYITLDTDMTPPTFKRSYFERTPLPWRGSAGGGVDVPHTMGDLFTSLTRANFRVDMVLEPEPPRDAPRSRHWNELMRWVPSTLIVRARKQGI
jgi:SAM-dependent methyltransferase